MRTRLAMALGRVFFSALRAWMSMTVATGRARMRASATSAPLFSGRVPRATLPTATSAMTSTLLSLRTSTVRGTRLGFSMRARPFRAATRLSASFATRGSRHSFAITTTPLFTTTTASSTAFFATATVSATSLAAETTASTTTLRTRTAIASRAAIRRHRLELFHQFALFEKAGIDLVFEILFNARERIDIAFADQREGDALGSGTTGAADAMHVVFRVIRKLEVHHHIDTLDVETASGDVGGNQNIMVAFALELLHHAIAL